MPSTFACGARRSISCRRSPATRRWTQPGMTPPWPHGDPRDVARVRAPDRAFTPPPRSGPPDARRRYRRRDSRGLGRAVAAAQHLTGNSAISIGSGSRSWWRSSSGSSYRCGALHAGLRWRRRIARAAGHSYAPRRRARRGALLARALDALAAGRHPTPRRCSGRRAARLDERGRVRYDPARTPGDGGGRCAIRCSTRSRATRSSRSSATATPTRLSSRACAKPTHGIVAA